MFNLCKHLFFFEAFYFANAQFAPLDCLSRNKLNKWSI